MSALRAVCRAVNGRIDGGMLPPVPRRACVPACHRKDRSAPPSGAADTLTTAVQEKGPLCRGERVGGGKDRGGHWGGQGRKWAGVVFGRDGYWGAGY